MPKPPEPTPWWTFLQKITGRDKNAFVVAQRLEVSPSSIVRWKLGSRPDPTLAVKIARAYGANVLSALVAAELITTAEARMRTDRPSDAEVLARISDADLAAELYYRLNPQVRRTAAEAIANATD